MTFAISVPDLLPHPDEFVDDIYAKAWPEVVTIYSTLLGIMLVLWLVSAFRS